MKKDYDIILATQIRGKWWRVDYINKTGIMEFETVEALDSHEAIIITSNIRNIRLIIVWVNRVSTPPTRIPPSSTSSSTSIIRLRQIIIPIIILRSKLGQHWSAHII